MGGRLDHLARIIVYDVIPIPYNYIRTIFIDLNYAAKRPRLSKNVLSSRERITDIGIDIDAYKLITRAVSV